MTTPLVVGGLALFAAGLLASIAAIIYKRTAGRRFARWLRRRGYRW